MPLSDSPLTSADAPTVAHPLRAGPRFAAAAAVAVALAVVVGAHGSADAGCLGCGDRLSGIAWLAAAGALSLVMVRRRIGAEAAAWTAFGIGLTAAATRLGLPIPAGLAASLPPSVGGAFLSMSPVAAAALMLTGAVVVLRARRALQPLAELTGLAGTLLAATGFGAACADVLGLSSPSSLASWIAIPLPLSIAMTLIGVAAAGQAWLDGGATRRGGPRWLPVMAGLMAWAATLALWQALDASLAGSVLPLVALMLGSALACARAVVVTLGQRAWRRSAESQHTSQQLLEALVDRNIAREALERREALLQSVLETMGEGVIAASASGEFLLFNRAARELLGVDAHDGPRTLEWADLIVATDPAVWPAGDRTLDRALRGERIDDLDICLRHADGHDPRWVSVFARPLALPFGLNGSMLVLRDVTERRQAQERLTQTARELERSNRELTEFASVASHDLRAPLRSVRSFVELLNEDYGATFSDEGREFVARIRSAVARMTSLIDGLLALARVRAKGEPFGPVDLGDVVRDVLADLAGALAESEGRVDVGTLPSLDADRLQMRQLLQNLIGNAIKFRRAGVPPHVHVSAQSCPGPDGGVVWELRFRDNGVGLDTAHADRIFKPFERLHGHSAFEGSGLGLALCARIVERHGGRIRAEGVPGEGATLVVTLPVSRRLLEAA